MILPVGSLVACCCVDDVDCIAEVIGNVLFLASVVDCCFTVGFVLARDLERKAMSERTTNERICKKYWLKHSWR